MSIVLPVGARIRGRQAETIRQELLFARRGAECVDPTRLTTWQFEHALAAGLIEPGPGAAQFNLTETGRGLVSARFGTRMTRKEASAKLEGFLDRIEAMDIAQAYGLRQVRVFGSVMRGTDDPADIDIALKAESFDSSGWTSVDDLKRIFGPEASTVFKDKILSREEMRWCDSAVIWEDGERLKEWRFEPAIPREGETFLASQSSYEKRAPEIDGPDEPHLPDAIDQDHDIRF
ncbi:hypothetical protein ACEUZ9_004127 [Paracoccus litorisediminis]|uniref:hypothetical protein n=1 Tax=Paracoccus litorisediminis TaxID=2006130 RepID=UPI00372DA7E2